MTSTAAHGREDAAEPQFDPERPVLLYPLVYLDEGDTFTVGRPDTDRYAILPTDGAELVRRLAAGDSPRRAAEWYAETYGEPVDIGELLCALDEMGFLSSSGGESAGPVAPPVRFQRLGRALFSWPAAAVYTLVVGTAVATTTVGPGLTPGYRQLFFTHYYSLIEILLFAGQFPLMLLHESAHVLAGRRLGLRSRVSVGRRLYFLVLETSLDGLVAVERRKRYLPMLAGMATDVVVWSVLVLVAAALRQPDGGMPLAGRICLALGFSTLLRILWQMHFYLRTDVYYMVTTALGCVDLHRASLVVLRNRLHRFRGRHDLLVDESVLPAADRRAARWYGWLMVAGYTVSFASLALIGLPTMYRFLTGAVGRISGHSSAAGLADVAVLITLNVLQIAVVAALSLRDRRARAKTVRHAVV